VVSLLLLAKAQWSLHTQRPSVVSKADTVWVSALPPEEAKEMARERTEHRTIGERVRGVEIMRPEDGKGPVVVYGEVVPADTAVSRIELDRGNLHTRLAVPQDSGGVRYVDLPVKFVGDCTNVVVGANGLVRCDHPRLGLLDLYTGLQIAVGSEGDTRVYPQVGVAWQKAPTSATQVKAFVQWEGEISFNIALERRINLVGR
jgi:hypothetical protein